MAIQMEFAQIFRDLPRSVVVLTDDNIHEFLEWCQGRAATDISSWDAAKVFERLTHDARFHPVDHVAQVVREALAAVFGYNTSRLPLGVDEDVVFHAARTLENAWGEAEQSRPAAAGAGDEDDDDEDVPPYNSLGDEPRDEPRYCWSSPACALPERLAAIWRENPLSNYYVRRKVSVKLPQIPEIGHAANFPTQACLKAHFMDEQLKALDNKSREIARGITTH